MKKKTSTLPLEPLWPKTIIYPGQNGHKYRQTIVYGVAIHDYGIADSISFLEILLSWVTDYFIFIIHKEAEIRSHFYFER